MQKSGWDLQTQIREEVSFTAGRIIVRGRTIEQVKKPMVVILDSASIHTAKALEPYWELLKEKGMQFYFLPLYNPELNRIEILWRKMKYEWLPF